MNIVKLPMNGVANSNGDIARFVGLLNYACNQVMTGELP